MFPEAPPPRALAPPDARRSAPAVRRPAREVGARAPHACAAAPRDLRPAPPLPGIASTRSPCRTTSAALRAYDRRRAAAGLHDARNVFPGIRTTGPRTCTNEPRITTNQTSRRIARPGIAPTRPTYPLIRARLSPAIPLHPPRDRTLTTITSARSFTRPILAGSSVTFNGYAQPPIVTGDLTGLRPSVVSVSSAKRSRYPVKSTTDPASISSCPAGDPRLATSILEAALRRRSFVRADRLRVIFGREKDPSTPGGDTALPRSRRRGIPHPYWASRPFARWNRLIDPRVASSNTTRSLTPPRRATRAVSSRQPPNSRDRR
jgi:hypothetical protein